jgi:hypothetical protein
MVYTVLYFSEAIATVAIAALVMGSFQAFALRGFSRRWWWWPGLNVLVLMPTASWMVTQGMQYGFGGGDRPGWYWMGWGLATGLVGGALKGGLLLWMGRSPQSPQSHPAG